MQSGSPKPLSFARRGQKPNGIRPPEMFGAGTYEIDGSLAEVRVGQCDGRLKDAGGF